MTKKIKKSSPAYELLLIVLYILYNVRYIAIQNETQRIQRFQGYIPPMLHPVQRIGGNALFIDQMVFRYAALDQRLIEWLITNHFITWSSIIRDTALSCP